jgi:hypothetical protein
MAIIWAVRIATPADKTLTWDVFGYYLWLPAKFVHHDFWLDNIQWVKDVIAQYHTTESLYQAYIGPNGTWMYWFLLGMGFMYMPFFFIGHLWAKMGGYPMDGFSLPYQISIAYGSVVYTCIGLFFFWKILKKFFTERVVIAVLLIIGLGTNYLFWTSVGGTATANFLFTLLAALVWFTIKWHEKPRIIYALLIGGIAAMIGMIKPSEIFCILIPVLWPYQGSYRDKFNLVRKHWWHWLIMVITGLIVLFPQFFYWRNEANAWIFDSYRNPGVGLDWDHPHILNFLFSFRKGWFIYTPIMVFAIVGFYSLYKANRKMFWPVFVYFIISFYIMASWTEWWYGGGFGQRPVVTYYAILALPLGYFLTALFKKRFLKWFIGAALVCLIALNLFQTWQFCHYIIHEDRMSFKYYMAIFGKTSASEEDRKLLLPLRSYNNFDNFDGSADYACRNIGAYDFEGMPYPDFARYYTDDTAHSGSWCLRMDSLEFSPEIRTTYSGITSKEYAWLKGSVYLYFADSCKGELPMLTITTLHKGDNYKYRTFAISRDSVAPNSWKKLEFMYQTPSIRSVDDEIVLYIWNPAKARVYIDDLRLDAFTIR